jgi:mandelamide amidase
MIDYDNLSIEQIAAGICGGHIRAEQLVESCLDRWRRLDGLHAVTWIEPDRVLAQARKLDQQQRRGEKLGKLAGVPYVIKDSIDCVGFPTTAGSKVLVDRRPASSAQIVQELDRHDALVLGKANMHELAMGGSTNNLAFGSTRNPHSLQHVPGGSSGGSGAVVGARIAPLALGSDTAGSVRIPAAFCGTAGYKPTVKDSKSKLYPDKGLFPVCGDLDTIGPLARTAADLDYFDSVCRGRARTMPPPPAQLRLGIPTTYFFEDLQYDVEQVTNAALDRLRSAGAQLVPVDISQFVQISISGFYVLLNAGICNEMTAYLAENTPGITMADLRAGTLGADVRSLLDQAFAAIPSAADLFAARNCTRMSARQEYERLFEEHGLTALAFPTTPILAPLVQELGDVTDARIVINGKDLSQNGMMIRNTMIGSFLGVPGISVPAGVSKEGLPVGLELDGLPFGDDKLLAVARTVERHLDTVIPPPI